METTIEEPTLIDLTEVGQELFKVQHRMKVLQNKRDITVRYAVNLVYLFAFVVLIIIPIILLFTSFPHSVWIGWFGSGASLVTILYIFWIEIQTHKQLTPFVELGDKLHFTIANDIEKNTYLKKNYQIPTFIQDVLDLYTQKKKNLQSLISNEKLMYQIYMGYAIFGLAMILNSMPKSSTPNMTQHQIDSLKRVNIELQKKIQELEKKR